MSLKENLETYKSLPVELDSKWSLNLPKVIWKGFDLTPKNNSSSILELSELLLSEALQAIYTELEYVSFLRLCAFLEKDLEGPTQEIQSLESRFHYRWNEESQALLARWIGLPNDFQTWTIEKKLKFNDLRPLLRADLNEIKPFLGKLSQTQASKSIGTEILECLCDLDGTTLEATAQLLEKNDSSLWLRTLKELSHPTASAKDSQRREKVRAWPWPTRMKGEWKRQGDQAGLAVEIYATNPADFAKKIESLNELCQRWKSEL